MDHSAKGQPKELLDLVKGNGVLALPQSATKILELTKNPENGPGEYEIPLLADPGLAAQILCFANSSFFGFSHRITTVRTALTLISIRTIRNFVLWNAVFSLLPNPRIGNFFLTRFYQDALRRAVFAKVLGGGFEGIDPEQLFVAGLFQDIALPVLIRNRPKEYADFLARLDRDNERLNILEQKNFGWNHGTAGGMLVEEWGLGTEIARCVVRHVGIDKATIDTPERIADAIVALSGLLPSADDTPNWPDADLFFMQLQRILNEGRNVRKKVALSPTELFETADVQFADMLAVARLQPPKYSLCDCRKEYFRSLEEN